MRILHTMLRVGDLDKSIDFYVNGLGMNLLRKKDYPHGKFTLAFVGYGSEKENSVIELTYNWGKKSEDYELGDKYGHIAIGVKDIHLICQGLENNGCKITTKPKTMKNRIPSSLLLRILMDIKLNLLKEIKSSEVF